jgi:hypothetical protein
MGLAGKTLMKAEAVVSIAPGTLAATNSCAGDTVHCKYSSLRLRHTIGGIATTGALTPLRIAVQPRVETLTVAGVAMAALTCALDRSSSLVEADVQRLCQLLRLLDDSGSFAIAIALLSTHYE